MLNSSINRAKSLSSLPQGLARTGQTGGANGVPSSPFMPLNGIDFPSPQDLRSQPMSFSGVPFTPDFNSDSDVDGGGECRRTQSLLSAYLDSELDPNSQNYVDAHLLHCPYCATVKNELAETDTLIKREWQRTLPLPSLSLTPKELRSIDSILASLPPEPVAEPQFATRRVHSRVRWVRFSAGLASLIALIGIFRRGK